MTTRKAEIKVLDHGYVKFIESWGRGLDGDNSNLLGQVPDDMEVGIIEAARQSTQGSFRGWGVWVCSKCGNQLQSFSKPPSHYTEEGIQCDGKLSNDEALLKFMYSHNHSTPFEFSGMTIEVQAPIMVFREWHRHRTQSYNEMSARYAPLPDLNYIPTKERIFQIQKNNTQAKGIDGAEELTDTAVRDWRAMLGACYGEMEMSYQYALKTGIPKELARLCLPVGRYSRMRASANLRNWLAFLTLRTAPNAQWEIQEYARAVSVFIQQEFPRTFNLFNGEK